MGAFSKWLYHWKVSLQHADDSPIAAKMEPPLQLTSAALDTIRPCAGKLWGAEGSAVVLAGGSDASSKPSLYEGTSIVKNLDIRSCF